MIYLAIKSLAACENMFYTFYTKKKVPAYLET